MLYPSIDQLLQKVDSKYSLVVAVARRARNLREGTISKLERPVSHKNVGVALEELYNDYIHFERVPKKERNE